MSCHTSCLRLGEYKNLGCVPFTPKNRLIDRCSQWDTWNPEWKFPRGFSCSISKTFSWKIGSKAIQGKRPGTSKNYQMGRTFGSSVWEFWSTLEEIPFSRENSVREDKINLSIYIPSEISGLFG